MMLSGKSFRAFGLGKSLRVIFIILLVIIFHVDFGDFIVTLGNCDDVPEFILPCLSLVLL